MPRPRDVPAFASALGDLLSGVFSVDDALGVGVLYASAIDIPELMVVLIRPDDTAKSAALEF